MRILSTLAFIAVASTIGGCGEKPSAENVQKAYDEIKKTDHIKAETKAEIEALIKSGKTADLIKANKLIDVVKKTIEEANKKKPEA
jgi:hypothetical protein